MKRPNEGITVSIWLSMLASCLLSISQALCQTPVIAPTAAELASRIDPTHILVRPNAADLDEYALSEEPGASAEALARELADRDGVSFDLAERSRGGWNGSNAWHVGTKSISISEESWLIVVRDEREYPPCCGEAPAAEVLTRNLERLLGALGVRLSQMDAAVKTLMKIERPADSLSGGNYPTSEATPVSEKLLLKRQIGGIPVIGDKLVFTLADGNDVRKILGIWHRVAYKASRLTTTSTVEEIAALAVDAVSHRVRLAGLQVAPDAPIRVWTGYVVLPIGNGEFALELRGFVDVPALSPSGGFRWSTLDFSLE